MSRSPPYDIPDVSCNGPETEYPIDYQYEQELEAELELRRLHHFTYTNHPLQNDEIRLFRLCPIDINHSHLNRLLKGTIITTTLSTSPSYVALSYTWGPPVFSRILQINDNEQLRITRGLDLALKRFRATSKYRGGEEEEEEKELPLIWVDQICINQQNTAERSAQVQLMRRIYSRAERVFVYLGESAGRTGEALANVLRGEYQKIDTVDGLLLPQHAIYELSNLTWFYRHWIIQEVVACPRRTWLVSNLQIEGDVLRWIHGVRDGFSNTNHQVSSILRFIEAKENGEPLKLFETLLASLAFQTSEPKDRIYSLLGIVADRGDYPVPDYSRSMDQVYQDFAKSFVEKGYGLSLISIAASQGASQGLLRTPSWVPDWQDSSWNGMFVDHEVKFEAGGGSPCDIGVSGCGSMLFVDCVTVDSITATADTYRGDLLINEWISSSLDFITKNNTTGDGSNPLLKLARLIFMNKDISIERLKVAPVPPPNSEIMSMLQPLISSILLEHSDNKLGDEENALRQNISQNLKRSWHFSNKLFKDLSPNALQSSIKQTPMVFCDGVKIAWTSGNRLCLVPADCKPRDKICIPLGAAQPFLLREQADTAAHRVVGNAYVEGVMHGEAVKESGFQCEQIVLR